MILNFLLFHLFIDTSSFSDAFGNIELLPLTDTLSSGNRGVKMNATGYIHRRVKNNIHQRNKNSRLNMDASKAGVIPISSNLDTGSRHTKELILIRHGCSKANEYMSKEGNYWGDSTFTDDATLIDSALSIKGIQQAQSLSKQIESGQCDRCPELKDVLLGLRHKDSSNSEVLIITSPLTRAIETLFHGILPHLTSEDGTCTKVVAQPLATERVYTASDTGRRISKIEKNFPMIDFIECFSSKPNGYNSNDDWWYTHDKKLGPYQEWRPNDGNQFYAVPGEPLETFHQRMVDLYHWVESRKEGTIILVTHWAVIRFFTGEEDVENCGVRVVDFGRIELKDGLLPDKIR